MVYEIRKLLMSNFVLHFQTLSINMEIRIPIKLQNNLYIIMVLIHFVNI